jgi:pimeloyl-ACP methyl ester carboxylesterase
LIGDREGNWAMQASEKVVVVGEFRVNCATAGKGNDVVMLHGSDKREDWRVWEPLLSLGDGFRLTMPDLVGYGKSSRPAETPDYRAQAHVLRDLLDRLGIAKADVIGTSWGGQVALEFALQWPESCGSIVLVASSYDKEQLPRLAKLRKQTLIIYAEDDMVTQQKAGYLLRDAIGTTRLEILAPVAHDPRHDFTISHKLGQFRSGQVLQLIRRFLTDPASMVSEPPELENELRGLALRKPDEGKKEEGPT